MLKKIEKPISIRIMDETFNKEGPIENTVEVNIYYQGHRERIKINAIGGQKCSVILGMPWLAHHNPEIDWRTEECGKQQRPKQRKLEQKKQKKEEKKEKEEKK